VVVTPELHIVPVAPSPLLCIREGILFLRVLDFSIPTRRKRNVRARGAELELAAVQCLVEVAGSLAVSTGAIWKASTVDTLLCTV
jgi:hypothetical protein